MKLTCEEILVIEWYRQLPLLDRLAVRQKYVDDDDRLFRVLCEIRQNPHGLTCIPIADGENQLPFLIG